MVVLQQAKALLVVLDRGDSYTITVRVQICAECAPFFSSWMSSRKFRLLFVIFSSRRSHGFNIYLASTQGLSALLGFLTVLPNQCSWYGLLGLNGTAQSAVKGPASALCQDRVVSQITKPKEL